MHSLQKKTKFIALFLVLSLLVGCGKSKSSPTIDIYSLASYLNNNVEFSSPLNSVDEKHARGYFDIPDSTKLSMYESNSTCEGIVVFEVADENDLSSVQSEIDEFIESELEVFGAYSPDDVNRLQNAVKENTSKIAVLVVCNDTANTKAIVRDILDGKVDISSVHSDTNASSEDTSSSLTDASTEATAENNTNTTTDATTESHTNTSTDATVNNNNNSPTDATDNNNVSTEITTEETTSATTETTTEESNISTDIPTIRSNGKVKEYSAITVIGDYGYSFYGYSPSVTKKYMDGLNKLSKTLDGQATVYSVPIPLACAITFPDDMQQYNRSSNQQYALSDMSTMANDKVKLINMYDLFISHRDEYLYFRTDHHWTALGAYYAYTLLCESKGITPYQLSDYKAENYGDFLGSYAYDDQGKERDKDLINHPDELTAYHPISDNTEMTITKTDGSSFKWPVIGNGYNYSTRMKYGVFAGGDYPLTVIKNKNLNDKSACIVIKDSFGNAFIPFLVDHYQTIYEIDFRYWDGSLAKFAKEHKVNDILFVTSITFTGSSYSAGKINAMCQ